MTTWLHFRQPCEISQTLRHQIHIDGIIHSQIHVVIDQFSFSSHPDNADRRFWLRYNHFSLQQDNSTSAMPRTKTSKDEVLSFMLTHLIVERQQTITLDAITLFKLTTIATQAAEKINTEEGMMTAGDDTGFAFTSISQTATSLLFLLAGGYRSSVCCCLVSCLGWFLSQWQQILLFFRSWHPIKI